MIHKATERVCTYQQEERHRDSDTCVCVCVCVHRDVVKVANQESEITFQSCV